jgi:hypothetical protein
MADKLAELIESLLQPNEEIVTRALVSPAKPDKTVLYKSALLLTNQRLLEVEPSLLAAAVGKKRVSSAALGLDEILQCDFRKGKMMWKNGGKNLVVVATKQGDFAWATPNAKVGEAFVAELSAALHSR